MYQPGCIHSSRPNWFIINTKRSDTCSRFLENAYQSCSYQLNEPKANQIISFIFARATYNAFNTGAMVTVMLYRWPYDNCTFVSATVSHNYSDIGTIKVDAYINTRRAQVDAIQTINSDEWAALMWFQRQLQRTRGFRTIALASSPRYLRKSVFKNQFLLDGCSD